MLDVRRTMYVSPGVRLRCHLRVVLSFEEYEFTADKPTWNKHPVTKFNGLI